MKRLRDGDANFFVRFYRMTPPTFDELHDMVKEDLTRQFFIREPLPSEERLAIAVSKGCTLYIILFYCGYLSSGQQIKDVALLYRVGLETARQAVHVTCRALWERLHQPFMKPPTEAEWVKIAEEFRRRWQFPNCLGAVDGKHVAITCPKDSGSVFYNYKGTYSIVLMAVVDSKYKFVLIEVGAEGRQSDGGIFKASEIGQGLDQGTLNLPKLGVLPGCQKPRLAAYAFVGDEAFQLRTDFLRLYPAKGLAGERRAYNYRLSRARRCAENAFGFMSARWRILLRIINLLPENVDYVVKSCCVLHNFLLVRKEHPAAYADQDDNMGNPTAGGWRREIPDSARELLFPLEATRARNFGDDADFARKMYMYYFCSPAGEVSWQWDQPGVNKQVARSNLRKLGVHVNLM
ncbi:unnamed protein product [Ixodes pacificus]